MRPTKRSSTDFSLFSKHNDINPQRRDDAKLSPPHLSSDEEGMPWPQAIAGVVGYVRHPTTPALAAASRRLLTPIVPWIENLS
jgi:hypothetical protein